MAPTMKKYAISLGNRTNMFKPRVNRTKEIQSRVHTNGIRPFVQLESSWVFHLELDFLGQEVEGVLVLFLQLTVKSTLS